LADWARLKVLKTRVITALIITALGLTALFAMSTTAFSALAAAVLLGLGGWEAARLAGLKSLWGQLLYSTVLLGLAVVVHVQQASPGIVFWLLPGCAIWAVFLPWLAAPGWGRADTGAFRSLKLTGLGIMLLSAWLSLSWLKALDPWLVFLLLIIIAAADIGAYFTGRTIGGPKLAPAISPGKTRAGAVGGLVFAMAFAALAVWLLPTNPFSALLAGGLAFALALLSIGGDLFISLLKRQRGIKDSSNLLPGHGGILDRFDSLGAALPFFALAVALWGSY
jgi:phosphatidate cytidylyltransferase